MVLKIVPPLWPPAPARRLRLRSGPLSFTFAATGAADETGGPSIPIAIDVRGIHEVVAAKALRLSPSRPAPRPAWRLRLRLRLPPAHARAEQAAFSHFLQAFALML